MKLRRSVSKIEAQIIENDPSRELNIRDLVNLDTNFSEEKAQNMSKFFDWNQYCYNFVPEDQRDEANRILERILDI